MKAKLTKRQAEVVKDIQNGATFICDSEIKGSQVCFTDSSKDYHIHGGVFFALVDKGVIYQQSQRPFDYVLSRDWITDKTTARDYTRGETRINVNPKRKPVAEAPFTNYSTPAPITLDMVHEAVEYLFRDLPRRNRTIKAMSGKVGYHDYLKTIGAPVPLNDLRNGMYRLGENHGFMGMETLGQPDGYRAVEANNADGSCSYFVDHIENGWCIAYAHITKEEFDKLLGLSSIEDIRNEADSEEISLMEL